MSVSEPIEPSSSVCRPIRPFALTVSFSLSFFICWSRIFSRINHCISMCGNILLPRCNYHRLNYSSLDILHSNSSVWVHDLLLSDSSAYLHVYLLLDWNSIQHLLLNHHCISCVSLFNCLSIFYIVCHMNVSISFKF